eukprot:gene11032-12281_t
MPIFTDEEAPPPVDNDLNVTAAEIVAQKEWAGKLWKRKANTLVPDADPVEAEVELQKGSQLVRLRGYNGAADQAPAWFTNAMNEMSQQMDQMSQQINARFDRLEETLRVTTANFNRKLGNQRTSHPLNRLLCQKAGSMSFGQEPPASLFFPDSRKNAFEMLNNAHLDALEEFYGEGCTAGTNLAQRIASFLVYIS